MSNTITIDITDDIAENGGKTEIKIEDYAPNPVSGADDITFTDGGDLSAYPLLITKMGKNDDEEIHSASIYPDSMMIFQSRSKAKVLKTASSSIMPIVIQKARVFIRSFTMGRTGWSIRSKLILVMRRW